MFPDEWLTLLKTIVDYLPTTTKTKQENHNQTSQ